MRPALCRACQPTMSQAPAPLIDRLGDKDFAKHLATEIDTLIWPHCDGLFWPHLCATRGAVMTV